MNADNNIKDVYGSVKRKDGKELFYGTRVKTIDVTDIGGKRYMTNISLN
jgi:hypothetical protein